MTETPALAGQIRGDQARAAILHAADSLFIEVGYGALTMEGISERAGVGQQTVYRWWSTKAEVLLAAAITDAGHMLLPMPQSSGIEDLTAYIEAVAGFLASSPAGAAYRVLIGEAANDAAVAQLMASIAIFDAAASTVLNRLIARGDLPATVPMATAVAILTGPAYYRVLESGPASQFDAQVMAAAVLAAIRQLGSS